MATAKKPEVVVELKPGYKTTEFWMATAAMIVGAVLASGALPESGVATQIIGGVAAVLAQLGYTASRGKVKAK